MWQFVKHAATTLEGKSFVGHRKIRGYVTANQARVIYLLIHHAKLPVWKNKQALLLCLPQFRQLAPADKTSFYRPTEFCPCHLTSALRSGDLPLILPFATVLSALFRSDMYLAQRTENSLYLLLLAQMFDRLRRRMLLRLMIRVFILALYGSTKVIQEHWLERVSHWPP